MKKKKKQSCSCNHQNKVCKPVENSKTNQKCEVCTPISSCKPCPTEKKPMHSYVDCPCGDYEITCVDKCVELSQKAEDLFEKACEYEADATQTFNEAEECEKSAKLLSQKACNLLKNSNKSENQAKDDESKAKELMQRAQELCEKAKSLKKEAECIEKNAKENCEKAKCLYEKAETYNEKAKCLYNQALKYDEKALECYKTAGDKIKEYEGKSKKCEEMIDKCGNKLENCENNSVSKSKIQPEIYDAQSKISCGCNKPSKNNCETIVEKTCKCNDEIIYIDMDTDNNSSLGDTCSTYVSPMYNMAPMQSMGNFTDKYPSLGNCNMYPYTNQYDEMWMNYYIYMQQMMQQMPYNK